MKLLDTIKKGFAFTATFLMLFAISSVTLAQDNNQNSEFGSWDADGDSTLTQDEFHSGLSDMGYYDDWDGDGNGEISEEEWNTGVEENLGNYDSEAYGSYSEWDENGDGVLSEDEFDNGLFDTVDENDDDAIEEDEFGNWYDDGLF